MNDQPSYARMTEIAEGARPTSAEVGWALRESVQEEIARLDQSEKSLNGALTPYGRFARVCLKRWFAECDLPVPADVARIVEAMEHDLLRNPPRGDVAAVMPMRDALTLYRVACSWIGHEPRVAKLEVKEAFCGQHFGSAQHPNRYVCELPEGHEGLHAAPSISTRQHAGPDRMELLGGGLVAEIGPLVIGEEIARQLNAGIEPATGKGAVDADLKMAFDRRCGAPFGSTGKPKEVCALRWDHPGPHASGVIRIDGLPEPTPEELEADAKLHEEIVEKMSRPDPDEVRRALDEQRRKYGHVEPEILAAAEAYLRAREQEQQEQLATEQFHRELRAAVEKPLSFDSRDWARSFMALFGHRKEMIDEGLMHAWFANAIMRGFDEHANRGELERALYEEVATWAERFCTSGRYEPQMPPQRGLYRALLRLQAVRTGGEVPPPHPVPDDESQLGEQPRVDAWQQAALRVGEDLGGSRGTVEGYYSLSPEKWLEWALGCLRDKAPDAAALTTAVDQLRACQQSRVNLLRFARHPEDEEAFKAPMSSSDWLVRDIIRDLWQRVDRGAKQIGRLSGYFHANQNGFRYRVGQDIVDAVIDTLKAYVEHRALLGGVVECEATDPEGTRFCHHEAATRLCHYHGRVWEVVEAANGQLARLSQYVASQPVSRFPGAAGRDIVDVVIDALKSSGEQCAGVLLETDHEYEAQLIATRRRQRRERIARTLLPQIIASRPKIDRWEERNAATTLALAWADELMAEIDR